ncbi:hypothetical protein [Marinobacter sp.]|uniref:hypothetical protein n=1 Tax=Marinobacter sp. TaxID=50741 RepID=UPI0034A33A86
MLDSHNDQPTYDWTYRYDGNWTHDINGTRRTITWDDENRIREIRDNGHRLTYTYDAAGQMHAARGREGHYDYLNVQKEPRQVARGLYFD